MHMQRIPPADPAQTTGKTKEHLDQIAKRLHRVPNMHATMAVAPAVLDAYLAMNAALGHSSLPADLRVRIALAVASANSAEYCLAAHTAAAKALKLDDAEIARARDAESSNPHYQAALKFARAVVEELGQVSDAEVHAAKKGGWTDAQVLEIVACACANIFTNYFNHAVATQIDRM
ncbi:MAG: carboxymuconolactone decarboxylase family protein [Elusimicrobia bacterium]|nr:carboxymuconolactone decarboxylase family protein [Elusimicrobiota bacterium]